ncbi:MAG: glycosyltransferase, partial [Gemmatimonadales bacterium]|nr:glycosyltransferase [Gemmatimonadales bacterium]
VADGVALSYSIVGEGPKRPALERMIADAGLRDRVTLLGARRHGEVLELLADHDLFVLPSRDEVTPVSLMEAAASGLPAIATEVGAVREFLDWDDALVVDSDSVDALQAGLRGLIEREQEWPVLGRMGRARVERDHDNRQLDRELSDLLAGAASVPTGSA